MFSFDEIKKLQVEKGTSAALISPEDSKKLVDGIGSKHNMNENKAIAALAIICQKGGTSKKAQGNIHAIVNGKRLELSGVRNIMKTINLNYTLRQWARTHATGIYQIGLLFGIEGDLSKKIARNQAAITADEKVWLSNLLHKLYKLKN